MAGTHIKYSLQLSSTYFVCSSVALIRQYQKAQLGRLTPSVAGIVEHLRYICFVIGSSGSIILINERIGMKAGKATLFETSRLCEHVSASATKAGVRWREL